MSNFEGRGLDVSEPALFVAASKVKQTALNVFSLKRREKSSGKPSASFRTAIVIGECRCCSLLGDLLLITGLRKPELAALPLRLRSLLRER